MNPFDSGTRECHRTSVVCELHVICTSCRIGVTCTQYISIATDAAMMYGMGHTSIFALGNSAGCTYTRAILKQPEDRIQGRLFVFSEDEHPAQATTGSVPSPPACVRAHAGQPSPARTAAWWARTSHLTWAPSTKRWNRKAESMPRWPEHGHCTADDHVRHSALAV